MLFFKLVKVFCTNVKKFLLFTIFFLMGCGDSAKENTLSSVESSLEVVELAEPAIIVEPTTISEPVIDVEPAVGETPITVQPAKVLVNQYSPLNHENGVSLNSSIKISLNKNIDSKEDITLTLTQDNINVEGELTLKNKQLVFTPQKKLQPDKTYNISIQSSESASNVIDLVKWEFTTQPQLAPKQKSTSAQGAYFPAIQTSGTTPFLLQPIESVKYDELVRVSFGIPFPKGFLSDISLFQIVDSDGIELPIATQLTLPWQSDNSIRSVQVQLDLSFSKDEYEQVKAKSLFLKWGLARTTTDLPFTSIKDTWVLVEDENYGADLAIYEPQAYAIFTPDWYGQNVIKNRLLPFHTNDTFSANDIAFKLFGDTAINHVDPRVIDEKLIPFKTSYAAWLFDRAMTLYQLAFKSGEYKFLRAAHRSSQFYLQKINEKGFFSLKTRNDFKYSYGESLLANLILTGDDRVPNIIEKMIPVWDSFRTQYTLKSNFWTERHVAYQLLGYLSAYEIFGTDELKDKAVNVFSILRGMQISPAEGIPKTGALMHTSGSHGEGGRHFIASPWMSTILIGAIERYYINFDDEISSDFVIKMADFFSQDDIAIHQWEGYSGRENLTVPHYLAGEGLTLKQKGGGGLSALEHAHDVTKIFSLAYYFSCKVECDNKYLEIIAKLNNSVTTFGFPHWIRTSAPTVGYSAFRLAPPRKFSWWFQHTANNNFLLGESIKLPFYNKNKPHIEVVQSHNAIGMVKPGDEITFSYKIKNLSATDVKNVVLVTNIILSTPSELIEIIDFDERGVNRAGSIAWKFDKIDVNELIEGLSFTIKVKDLPALQSKTRPIGDIVSYVKVGYCTKKDDEPECVFPTKPYDLGKQPIRTTSNWQQIKLVKSVTPPLITLNNIMEGDLLSGDLLVTAQVEDENGISRVNFYLDDKLVNSSKVPPFEYTLRSNALSNDEHKLTVKAWDIYGSEGIKTVAFSPQNPDITPPSVTITSNIGPSACEDVLLTFDAVDTHGVKSCEITLDENTILLNQCNNYKIPLITPLFSASAILSFDGDEPFNSTNAHSLIGENTNTELTDGYVNNGIFFGSEKSYVNFKQTHLDINNEITVSFWMKPSADESVILSQDWYYIGIERGWAISLGANNHKNNNPLSITWSSGNNSNNLNNRNIVQSPTNSVELDVWQHVVVRKKDKLVEIFVNGEEVASADIYDENIRWPYNSDKILSLGKAMKHTLNYDQYYNGLLDEVAIWNSAISDSAIKQLYNRNKSIGDQKVVITAIDGAGNRGTASTEFKFDDCQ